MDVALERTRRITRQIVKRKQSGRQHLEGLYVGGVQVCMTHQKGVFGDGMGRGEALASVVELLIGMQTVSGLSLALPVKRSGSR